MSYDVTFTADMGLGKGENPALENGDRNYTSNVGRMWRDAIGEPSVKYPGESMPLSEAIETHPIASELLPLVERGVQMMAEAPEHFRAMNPPNGWGDYEGALEYLVWIRDCCRLWPSAIVEVSW